MSMDKILLRNKKKDVRTIDKRIPLRTYSAWEIKTFLEEDKLSPDLVRKVQKMLSRS